MYEAHAYVSSPRNSFSASYGGYAPLKNPNTKEKAQQNNGHHSSNICLCPNLILSFLYRFMIAFLRLLCFRLPKHVHRNSLLTVEYKNNNKEEDLGFALIDNELTEVETRSFSYSEHKKSFANENLSYSNTSWNPKETAVAVNKIRASQVKGYVIASKGKDQMYKTKIVVSKSKQQLRQVQDDITNIRGNIETAKKLFDEVEKGIKDYKWDSITREPWAGIEYRGELCYFPMSSSVRYITPMERMYIDHKIFVEEMKFHFKWNHGILL